jgi:hypothetical protein
MELKSLNLHHVKFLNMYFTENLVNLRNNLVDKVNSVY